MALIKLSKQTLMLPLSTVVNTGIGDAIKINKANIQGMWKSYHVENK